MKTANIGRPAPAEEGGGPSRAGGVPERPPGAGGDIPFWQAGAARIYQADARRLGECLASPVHVVVTSPPYNVGLDYDLHHDDLAPEAYRELLAAVFAACWRVMLPGARICLVVPLGVGRRPWQPLAPLLMDVLRQTGFELRGVIVWDKGSSGNRTTWGSWRLPTDPSFRDTTELIVVAGKGRGVALPVPDAVLERGEHGRVAPWLPADYFMALAQDHWRIAPESAQAAGHPAPFPVDLVTRLLHFYAYPGAHVLDPFAGSGTTGLAALRFGCSASLFEISAAYCRLAADRLQGEISAGRGASSGSGGPPPG